MNHEDPRILRAMKELNEVRKRAIVEGWGREALTFAMTLCLEADRLAAADAGYAEMWTRAHDDALKEAQAGWERTKRE